LSPSTGRYKAHTKRIARNPHISPLPAAYLLSDVTGSLICTTFESFVNSFIICVSGHIVQKMTTFKAIVAMLVLLQSVTAVEMCVFARWRIMRARPVCRPRFRRNSHRRQCVPVRVCTQCARRSTRPSARRPCSTWTQTLHNMIMCA
jgi:hypothetical protein